MSQQYTSRTAALKAITIDASKVRIKEKIGAPTYTNVADLINSKVSKKDFEYAQIDNASEHSSIWCELDTKATHGDISDAISEINKEIDYKINEITSLIGTSAVMGDYINVHGQMIAVPATTITNMNAWLREQVNPLRETYLSFNDVILGSANETTHVYFNDLRTVGCPQLFSTATISGTVVIHLPVLETIGNNTLFNNLTLNGDLYVEVPHYDYPEVYVVDNNGLTNNGGNIYITAPPHITAAATR